MTDEPQYLAPWAEAILDAATEMAGGSIIGRMIPRRRAHYRAIAAAAIYDLVQAARTSHSLPPTQDELASRLGLASRASINVARRVAARIIWNDEHWGYVYTALKCEGEKALSKPG